MKQAENETRWADDIRAYIMETRIISARKEGESQVTIRAGDISKEMIGKGLLPKDRVPNVCQVLDGKKLENLARIRLLRKEGVKQGHEKYVTFELL